MKKASIVSIGNEILNGQTPDTNATWLSKKLFSLSIPVASWHVAGDEIEQIARSLQLAAQDADLILVTGGLGPTDDDVTRQGLANFLNVPLEFHNELLEKIQQRYAVRNVQMPEINKVQAYLPAGAQAIDNPNGTAPGIFASANEKIIFVMPGVPSEMKSMFENFVAQRLTDLAAGQTVLIKKLKCFGTGESNIAELLGDMMRRDRNPLINCTVHAGVITLHIIAFGQNKETLNEIAQKDEQLIRNLLGDFVFGTGEQTLPEVVGEKLKNLHKKIAVAESCTGGLLSKLITDIPGASEYFTFGWVTYSNDAKISELEVPKNLIEKYGAVSEQIAAVMAEQARNKSKADFAISITGIAGPAGGTEEKPVGLVYIGLSDSQDIHTKRFMFLADRESVRMRSALTALNMLRLKL